MADGAKTGGVQSSASQAIGRTREREARRGPRMENYLPRRPPYIGSREPPAWKQ